MSRDTQIIYKIQSGQPSTYGKFIYLCKGGKGEERGLCGAQVPNKTGLGQDGVSLINWMGACECMLLGRQQFSCHVHHLSVAGTLGFSSLLQRDSHPVGFDYLAEPLVLI